MSKQTHTPGPYRFGGDYSNGGDIGIVSESTQQLVAMVVVDEDNPQGDDEHFANARLFKAAPDLLAALESAELSTTQIRMAADIGNKSAAKRAAWFERQLVQLGGEIRAAIAKAKR